VNVCRAAASDLEIAVVGKWTAKQYIKNNLRYTDTKELVVKEFSYPPEDKPFIRSTP